MPEIELPEYLYKTTLPSIHDNSDQPYYRELFAQVATECGQYSAIAFNFTYELDYRRNLPANVPENLYPTHYTYNFDNGGYGWYGVNYFQSYEIVRTNGQPNEADYGGTAAGGPAGGYRGMITITGGCLIRLKMFIKSR